MSELFPDPAYSTFRTAYSNSSVATVNTTTETSILSSGVGTKLIPANWLVPGRVARLIISGMTTTPTLGVGTGTVRVKFNGTTVTSGVTSGLLGNLNNANFRLAQTITCLTAGPAGTVVIAGSVDYVTGLNFQRSSAPLNSISTTVNTTLDTVIDASWQWGAGLSGHTATTLACTLELLPVS